jgi:hypothetical protein
MAQQRAKHRGARRRFVDGTDETKKDPRHHISRELEFDPEQEGRNSAATSIEAFKKALDDGHKQRNKLTHSA